MVRNDYKRRPPDYVILIRQDERSLGWVWRVDGPTVWLAHNPSNATRYPTVDDAAFAIKALGLDPNEACVVEVPQ